MITNVGDEPTSNAKVGKMPVVESSAEKIRFDVFVVDPRAGELLKEGRKIKLQEQPFRVLFLLLQKCGEVVTRDELRQELWPADTFVDFDHGLNSAVARLREALGDSAEKPRFIETVAKRGYRFIAPIRANEEAPTAAGSGHSAGCLVSRRRNAGPEQAFISRASDDEVNPRSIPRRNPIRRRARRLDLKP